MMSYFANFNWNHYKLLNLCYQIAHICLVHDRINVVLLLVTVQSSQDTLLLRKFRMEDTVVHKVLVLYVGGTIGMQRNEENGETIFFYWLHNEVFLGYVYFLTSFILLQF